jgi:hypothetical protein
MPQQTSLVSEDEHATELEQQKAIAKNIADEQPVQVVAPPEADVGQPKVTLVPTEAVNEYPIRVSLVGLDEEIVFESASDSAEVSPPVAEQVRFLDTVAVAE